MNNYLNISIIVLSILTLVLVVLMLPSRASSRRLPLTAGAPLKTHTEFEVLRRVALDKLDLVKRRSGVFSPYNEQIMTNCEEGLRNAQTLDQLVAAFLFMPNKSIGTHALEALEKPQDTTLFQFEQGTTGWYWGYATYPTANIMFYIIRLDLGTPETRAKHDLDIGKTTLYCVSVGAGSHGKWYYSPYIICGGTYTSNGDNMFEFKAGWKNGLAEFDGDKQDYLIFTKKRNKEGIETLGLDFNVSGGIDADNPRGPITMFGSKTTFTITQDPTFNNPKGCAPCASGAGTLYWSYTQLSAISSITIGNQVEVFKDGDGWLDRQWMRSNDPRQLIYKIFLTIMQSFKSTGGLGRYIWLNIHLTKIQYMITAFPRPGAIIKKGDTYAARYNTYSKLLKSPVFRRRGAIRVDEVITVQGVVFPSLLTVTLSDLSGTERVYSVDTRPYGKCVTLDITGNLHWSGSAKLEGPAKLDGGRGTAFAEFNQFEDIRAYRKTTLEKAGMATDDIQLYTNAPLNIEQILPSLLVVVAISLLIVSFVVLLVIGVKKEK